MLGSGSALPTWNELGIYATEITTVSLLTRILKTYHTCVNVTCPAGDCITGQVCTSGFTYNGIVSIVIDSQFGTDWQTVMCRGLLRNTDGTLRLQRFVYKGTLSGNMLNIEARMGG